MSVLYAIVFLCLVSVSNSATLVCEDLVRPIDQLDHIFVGRWALAAGGLTTLQSAYVEKFKTRDSASIHFLNETSKMTLMRAFSFGDSCYYSNSSITVGESGFSFADYNTTVTFLYTSCPDCMLMRFDNESKDPLRLYLFSRSREMKEEEVEEFKAQAKCFNMLPPIMMDPTKELCPEHVSSDLADPNDATTDGQKA